MSARGSAGRSAPMGNRGSVPFPTTAMPPRWWVNHGHKMEVAEGGPKENELVLINGEVARLVITRSKSGPQRYELAWNVHHACGHTEGHVRLDSGDLLLAFGLIDGKRPGHSVFPHAPETPDADAEGAYFRRGNYLNIPHPGTGLQGDPNISVFLTSEIKRAVKELIGQTALAF